MATVILKSIFFVIFSIYVFGDEIEMEVQSRSILKMLRDMVNQTDSNPLNLPANYTSIRENVTDNFSCKNRTYGFYADVENECQIYHVCLQSQSSSGRNVTYKWSFICPKETVFNQEVLVCTRPMDSIPCDESPNFYDLNMEIGKIADPDIKNEIRIKETETVTVKNKKQTIRKKQNIIMEALMKEADDQMDAIEEIIDGEKIIELPEETEIEIPTQSEEPIRNFEEEVLPTSEMNSETLENPMPAIEESANERLGSERNMKRKGRKLLRGSMKFKSSV